ncbi:MAG: GyrI-like domain-containing protein [Planctomycetes bacterium]|nr:GyrI-like domain-containing protein [Planctomycetota bacterium]
MKPHLACGLLFCATACAVRQPAFDLDWPATAIPASSHSTPALQVDANWKERMAQPYVFVEHTGDYRKLGDAMRTLLTLAQESGVERSGAPFALFFDDPGHVPLERLRARACLPVKQSPDHLEGLRFEILPRAMVVYARVAGAYTEVSRSYQALFVYLRELGWQSSGPIREVYLVNPADVVGYDQLETEVQIPWGVGGLVAN